MSTSDNFRSAMRAAGLDYGGPILADGELHRFMAEGDKARNSWYVLHAGPPAAGAFGCWKHGVKETWCDRNGHLSQDEWNRVRERFNEAERARELAEMERHASARKAAARIVRQAKPTTTHTYLDTKGVQPHGDIRTYRGALVAPLRNSSGELHSLQFIGADGSKKFLTGGRIAGCYFIIADNPDGPLVLCEGFATGASIHEATGFAVICAMHAGNLEAVAVGLREKSPKREIIVAADNDQFTEGNPGLTKATAAAKRICAKLAVPEFQDVTAEPTDFNDLHQLASFAEVARQIEAALAAAQSYVPPPDLHDAPPKNVSKPAITLPDEPDEPETAPFPLDALPPVIALMAAGVARTERVPERLSGPCVLGIISAVIGAGLEVQSDTRKTVRGNLFLFVSAETGAGKSRAFEPIAAPLLDYQERQQESWRKESAPRIQSHIKAAEAKIKRLEKDIAKQNDGAECERLRGELQLRLAERDEFVRQNAQPLILAQDATTERLTAMVQEQGEVLFSASSDCRKVVENLLGRYSANNSTDESFYLAGYTGEYVRVDRGSRPPVILRRPCLGVLWFGQPDLVEKMLGEDSLSASGFLPRMLMCHSHAEPQRIDGEPETISESVLAGWSTLVTDLLATYHQPSVHHVVQPTPETRQRFNDYHNAIVERRKAELRDVTGFAARWCENAWRLAVVLHAGLYGADAHTHALELNTADNAIRLSEWFAREQLEILSKGRRAAAAKLEDQVLELLDETHERKQQDFVTARDVLRARIVTSADAARALLEHMERDGLLVGDNNTPSHGGKTTRIYRRVVNPVPE